MFIPDDLIGEIFSGLPVKSILRFRHVSKYCGNLVSDPDFVKFHLKRSSKRNPQFILKTDHTIKILCDSNVSQVDEGFIPYSVCTLIQNPSFSIQVDPYFTVKNYEYRFIGSCNGFICFVGENLTSDYYNFWLQLWNPATRTKSQKLGFIRVFHHHPNDGYYKFNFGYDNSTGTYKAVALRYNQRELRSNVRILSLGDNVWRDIGSFPVDPMYLNSAYQTCDVGVYFKSTINWLAIQNHFWYDSNDINDISVEQFVIVSLDLRTETYNQYLLPPDFDEVPPIAPIVSVLGDCLCFSYCYEETDFVIWKMEEFGVEDSWTQFLKISYRSLQIDYDYSDEDTKYNFELVPLFLSKDADTLVLKSSHEYQEILYNWRNSRVVRTNITARKKITDDRTIDFVSCSANAYFESLLSVI
ncbi:F-box/kelch-repeat protein At3g23880-like [Vicia villosa]|uniref:F-box/kelch-repeat protein At3g23880-like n=1 Tax=Vicia villosa TaxID=3911 RepID=UPI00273A8E45|nr:F-box/kelch-repeat protein At3g23880-like [Vicia villosa]